MKRMLFIGMALLLCFAFTSFAGDEKGHEGHDHAMAAESPWFDMPNCDFCKNLLKDDKLMDNMIWEHHEIHNGFVTITTVKPDFKESYQTAMGAMMHLGNEMETGKVKPEEVKMCNFCQNYGMLMEAGAKFEYIMGDGSDVTIISSDDPEVVEKIKKFGNRTNMELAKAMKAEKAKMTE